MKSNNTEVHSILNFTFEKNFMGLFYAWSSTASRLQVHYEETVYFLGKIRASTAFRCVLLQKQLLEVFYKNRCSS